MRDLVTDADLTRARDDPTFRQKLLADHLEQLLDALDKMRKSSATNDSDRARQIREGAELAMQLADRLQKTENGSGPSAA